jgi:hypothetical protein
MREILRTNEPIVLNFAEALLRDAGLAPTVADSNISLMEGSIGIFPRRLLVPADALGEARAILEDAGLGSWIIKCDDAPD